MNWQFCSILIHSLILRFLFSKQKKLRLTATPTKLDSKQEEQRVRVTTQQQMSTSSQQSAASSQNKQKRNFWKNQEKNPFTPHISSTEISKYLTVLKSLKESKRMEGGDEEFQVYFSTQQLKESNESRCVVMVKRKSAKNSRTGRQTD